MCELLSGTNLYGIHSLDYLSVQSCRNSGPDYPLCRLYHGRGDVQLNVQAKRITTTKKSSTFLGKKCTATDKKILALRTRKGPPPYVGMGPPNG